ncbi:MAG: tetratricopeptide repeat protein [Tepidisphaeraceae bacterium]|jgi:tetratricopeptide (TPR) repeat protein
MAGRTKGLGQFTRFAVLMTLLIGAAGGRICRGSTESVQLTRQGAEDLDSGLLDQGLSKMDAAVSADPTDGQAVFFTGVALNRLGRYAAALETFQKSADMGFLNPDFPFERGWALLGLGRWSEAVASLETYERAHPGRGQTSEFLGRAYLQLGRLDKARAEFEQALRRDPSLKPTVDFYMSALEGGTNGGAAAKPYPVNSATPPPASAIDRFHFRLSLDGGYNSNVFNLPDGTVVPSGTSRKGSSDLRVMPDLSYDLVSDPNNKLTIGDQFEGEFNQDGGAEKADVLDDALYVQAQHALSHEWAVSAKFYDDYTMIGDASFRNLVAARPAIAFRPVDWAVTEASYIAQDSEYLFPSITNPLRRSGLAQTATITEYITVPGTSVQLRAGYFHEWNQARGSDFVFQSDAGFAGLSSPIIWGIVGDIGYTRLDDKYAHLNSFTAGVSPRRDYTDFATAQLSKEIAPHITLYVSYQYIGDASNIPFYKYNQSAVCAGATIAF